MILIRLGYKVLATFFFLLYNLFMIGDCMKLNNKGFTLIELLVTIVIIALVVGLSVFGIVSIINNSEEKATAISEKSIKDAANIYSTEVESSSWKKTNNYDAFCVTVGELMNKGLLDKDGIISNKNITKNTYVIVKRNNVTLAVEKEEIVSDIIGDENNKICTGQVDIDGENYTNPVIGISNSYTDKIEIPFSPGAADSGVSGYKCLYGESSSSVNKEGLIEENKCILGNLKNNKDYYVLIYMNTNNGASVLADGNRNYVTSDFINTIFNQNKNEITINYNRQDTNGNSINNPGYYFNSSVAGTSNIDLEVCTLENNKYICTGNTKEITENTWYKIEESEINITYPDENNIVKIDTRIYDGSNNYKEDEETFNIYKYTVKFYKNGASSIDGSTNEYIEKYCIAGGTDSCSITSPGIVAPTGYAALGWNTNSSATNSSWNVGTLKQVDSNASYYAILNKNTYTITYNANGGSGAPSVQTATIGSATTLSNDIPSRVVTNVCNSHENYIFLGWSTDSLATSASYFPGGSFTHNGSDDITLYAVWEKDNVRFTVDSNRKVTVYHISSCTTAGVCNYNQLNSNYSSGTIIKSNLYINDVLKNLTVNNVRVIKELYFSYDGTICYCSPDYNSSPKATFPWCHDVNRDGIAEDNHVSVYLTSVDGWYYSKSYDCYIPSESLTCTKPTAGCPDSSGSEYVTCPK